MQISRFCRSHTAAEARLDGRNAFPASVHERAIENEQAPCLRPSRTIGGQSFSNLASGLIVATLIILFLYMGREILEPLVIAALLGFILAPLIRRLRNWGLWRVPSVILTVLLAMAVLAALGSTIVIQVAQLAEGLPKYESNLRAKIRALGGGALTSSALERASGTLKDLQIEISKSGASAAPTDGKKPLVVEVRQPEVKGLESIANVVRPLLSPLATTALAVLFLMFILLQREDIRDRFLRLAGTADLQRSTAALDDAAARLSRFFLMQTIINTGFGILIGTGLWLIGVPNAVLWGILAGLMRFVPFVGSIIAAFFPIALAAAVDPGWTMVLLTAALFVVAEPLAGHVIEPVLYGQHTGLSPVAIVVSTLFWALLWGPIGLLLATPLTVCLVVLGRHIDALEFIEVLLGDEPALEPEERFYQRLLADDATEATDQAEKQLKEQTLSAYYDSVPMKALALAQADAARGSCPQTSSWQSETRCQKSWTILSTIQRILPNSRKARSSQFPPCRRSNYAGSGRWTTRCFASPAVVHWTRLPPQCSRNSWRSMVCRPGSSHSVMWPLRKHSRSMRRTHVWFVFPISG